MGGINVCRVIIMAGFVDRNLERTGHRREGMYISLSRVMGKLYKLLESLVLVLLGLLFGYVSGENPGPQPEYAFRFLMSVFPLACIFIAWIISRRLPLENNPPRPHRG